jgi:DNA ligase 1
LSESLTLHYRKFLDGKQNGVQPKSKQSTLAFSDRKAKTKKAADDKENGAEEAPTADKTMNGGIKSPSSEIEVEDGVASNPLKREKIEEEDEDSDKQPVVKRRRKSSDSMLSKNATSAKPAVRDTEETQTAKRTPPVVKERSNDESISEGEEAVSEAEEASAAELDEKPQETIKKHAKIQATIISSGKDPYPDWKAGDPVPYAALCTTFSLIEMTMKRLEISAHCSLFLQQVLRLTPGDLLSTVQLMINKVAADYAGIELGIGESLIIKAISETTGRTLAETKADHHKIGDLGLVAAKSRSNQRTMFKPKPLTVRGVHEGLLAIASLQGHGAQDRKVNAIKKLLSAADAAAAAKGQKGIDITKDKGGASESKFLIRFLEGKLRLGLAEKTVIVALGQAMVKHEASQRGKKLPSSEQMAQGEAILKAVYR